MAPLLYFIASSRFPVDYRVSFTLVPPRAAGGRRPAKPCYLSRTGRSLSTAARTSEARTAPAERRRELVSPDARRPSRLRHQRPAAGDHRVLLPGHRPARGQAHGQLRRPPHVPPLLRGRLRQPGQPAHVLPLAGRRPGAPGRVGHRGGHAAGARGRTRLLARPPGEARAGARDRHAVRPRGRPVRRPRWHPPRAGGRRGPSPAATAARRRALQPAHADALLRSRRHRPRERGDGHRRRHLRHARPRRRRGAPDRRAGPRGERARAGTGPPHARRGRGRVRPGPRARRLVGGGARPDRPGQLPPRRPRGRGRRGPRGRQGARHGRGRPHHEGAGPHVLQQRLLPRARRGRDRARHQGAGHDGRRAPRGARARLQAARLARAGEAGDQGPAPGHGEPRVHPPLPMRRGAWLALVFGAGGLAVTLWLLGEDLGSLGRVPAWAFAVGAALVVVNYAAGAVRLRLLTALGGRPLPLGACLRAYALGLFTAAITPGSAGQAPAVALALMRDGLTGAAAWSVNVYVWVLDLAFLAYSVPLSLLLIGRSVVPLSSAELVVFAAAVAALAAFLMWVLTFRLRWVTRLGRSLFSLRWLERWRGSALPFFERVESASDEIMRGTF